MSVSRFRQRNLMSSATRVSGLAHQSRRTCLAYHPHSELKCTQARGLASLCTDDRSRSEAAAVSNQVLGNRRGVGTYVDVTPTSLEGDD